MDERITDSKLHHSLFLQREAQYSHLPYEKELHFYKAVQNGDIELLKQIIVPLDNLQLGVLSSNPLRNMQYHLTITIAFITRFCIEGGMDFEAAYTLSDVNIRKLDHCTSPQDVTLLHHELIFDYAMRMKKIHTKPAKSIAVAQCVDYILNHLHDAITLEALARHTEKNITYLCSLFKKEMNTTIGQYIVAKRVEAAENMLKYSDYLATDICNYLAFNSHSHFIHIFKKHTGLTPKEYRNQHYRSKWK